MGFFDDVSRWAGNKTGGFLGDSDEERRKRKEAEQAKIAQASQPKITGANYTPSAVGRNFNQFQQQRNVVNDGLDKKRSYEEIQKKTGLSLEAIREFTDTTRPGYGVKDPGLVKTLVDGATEGWNQAINNTAYALNGKDIQNERSSRNSLAETQARAVASTAKQLRDPNIDSAKRARLNQFMTSLTNEITDTQASANRRVQIETDAADPIKTAAAVASNALDVATLGVGGLALQPLKLAAKQGTKTLLKEFGKQAGREALAAGSSGALSPVIRDGSDAQAENMLIEGALGATIGAAIPTGIIGGQALGSVVSPAIRRALGIVERTVADVPLKTIKEETKQINETLASVSSDIKVTEKSVAEQAAKPRIFESLVAEANTPLSAQQLTNPDARAVYGADRSVTYREPVEAADAAIKTQQLRESVASMQDADYINQIADRFGIDRRTVETLLAKTNKADLFEKLNASGEYIKTAGNPDGAAVRIIQDATRKGQNAQNLGGVSTKEGLPEGYTLAEDAPIPKAVEQATGDIARATAPPKPVLPKETGAPVEIAGATPQVEKTPTPLENPITPDHSADVSKKVSTATLPVKPINEPIKTKAPLGKISQDFYDTRKGNTKITFNDIKAMAETAAARAYNEFKGIGSDLSHVARTIQEAADKGAKSLDEIAGLTADEKQLWRGVQEEMDYMRRRSSLGGKEVSGGDLGETYFPHVDKNTPPTRDSLFQGFRDKKPGSEFKRKKGDAALQLDKISYSPRVLAKYIIDHSDSKLLREERISRALKADNPDVPEKTLVEAGRDVIKLQNEVNSQTTKITLGGLGKKVTVSAGKVIDFAKRMSEVGAKLGREQMDITGTPRGLTNGDRINSVDVEYKGAVHTAGDFFGLNQHRDAGAYAGTQMGQAGGDRQALAQLVGNRLKTAYDLPDEAVKYAVESVARMKTDLPENVAAGKVESIYRNAAKSQLMAKLQDAKIKNNTLRKDISELANQIVREGTTEQALSAKLVQTTLRAQNALFRKLNVSSALNEMSDLSSFFAIYGKDLKVATPDFSMIKKYGVGELDPALDPYLKAIDSGTDVKSVLSKINDATRLYKFAETYKTGVFLKTAEKHYAAKGLTGDALTERVLKDYRDFALPVDQFTKTFLNDFPLFTQYLSWGARNMQKEGRLLTGQFDAGIMADKTTAQRVARDLYANIPAKTAFWIASNGLKGTAIMTAFGLTDFTGLSSQDYSGIAEEDKSTFDKTTQFTNISTTGSLINTLVQAWEKEQLKTKYKDADYNQYEHSSLVDTAIKTYTPQFVKNSVGSYSTEKKALVGGAKDLMDKGYSESADGRVQYEAPTDAYNIFKAFVFGKNQTEKAREYSGRKNIEDRVSGGTNPLTAVKDMAAENFGQNTDYNRPVTKDYSAAYKAVDKNARTALLEGGKKYNDYLDNLQKNNPKAYTNYITAMDGNHVSPEYWRNIAQSDQGGSDLTTFKMIRDRKIQLQKDLGTGYDPLYDLPDDQASAVLAYKSAPTGTDLSLRNTLGKEQWYKDLKARQKEFYNANPIEATDSQFTSTERVKQWDKLDDELGTFYYDKESGETPIWGTKYPLVLKSKQLEFGSKESDAFYKANYDAYKAQKTAYDKEQLGVINKMRKIEGYPDMSWEAYQQATKVVDTDTSDDKNSSWGKSGSGSSSRTGINDTITNFGNSASGMKPIAGPTRKLQNVRQVVKKSKRASSQSPIRIKI